MERIWDKKYVGTSVSLTILGVDQIKSISKLVHVFHSDMRLISLSDWLPNQSQVNKESIALYVARAKFIRSLLGRFNEDKVYRVFRE